MEQVSITRQISTKEDVKTLMFDIMSLFERRYDKYSANCTISFENLLGTDRKSQTTDCTNSDTKS